MSETLSILAISVVSLEKGQDAIRADLADLKQGQAALGQGQSDMKSELADTQTVLLEKLETVEFDTALIKGLLMPDTDKG